MDTVSEHINRLKIAEQQFRLACTVNLAVANQVQTLDVPIEWVFGRHRVSYADFGLRRDQADLAASQLELTATLVVSGAIRDAIIATHDDPKSSDDHRIRSAYQISRMMRNAFGHSFVRPQWSIDKDCRDQKFTIENVIELDTSELNGKPLDWRDYGGPLAVFAFCRYVRTELLCDSIDLHRTLPPFPSVECFQQGRLVLRRIDELPDPVTEVARADPGEYLCLGDGHYVGVAPRRDS
ncbi:MAG: hypothetical protein ACK4TP_04825 [Hyphomicrobium sp.]